MKILLVDDTIEIRELIRNKLRAMPAEVVELGTGSSAANLLKTEKFDLIICDFNMPEGKGDIVLAARNDLGIETPFVYFSSEINLKYGPGISAIFDKLQIPELLQFARDLKGGL